MTWVASLASCLNSFGFSQKFRNISAQLLTAFTLRLLCLWPHDDFSLSCLFDFGFYFSLFYSTFRRLHMWNEDRKKNIAMKLKMLKAIFLFNHLLISVCEYVQRYKHIRLFSSSYRQEESSAVRSWRMKRSGCIRKIDFDKWTVLWDYRVSLAAGTVENI